MVGHERPLVAQHRRCPGRVEGIAPVRTNGVKPDYRTCCHLDVAAWAFGKQRADGGRGASDPDVTPSQSAAPEQRAADRPRAIKAAAKAATLRSDAVVEASYAAHLAGLSFTTAAGAIEQLAEAGIVRQVRACERNRLFEAPAALGMFELLEAALLPRTPESRESLIERSIQDLRQEP